MGSLARRIGLGVAVLALLAGAAGRAEAAFVTVRVNVGGQAGERVEMGDNAVGFKFGEAGGTPIFNALFTEASVGQTLTVNSGADFQALVTLLTNGAPNLLALDITAAPSGTRLFLPGPEITEPNFFNDANTDPDVANDTDLAGFDLQEIMLTVNNLTFELSSNDRDHVVFFDATFTFSDQVSANPVPEPSSLVLGGVAGVMFAGRAWSRRRRPTAAA